MTPTFKTASAVLALSLDPCPKATIETSNTINNRAIPLFMTFSLALFVIPVILLEKFQLIQSILALP